MELKKEEIDAIAYVLDDKISDIWHEVCWSVIKERQPLGDWDLCNWKPTMKVNQISDEDITKIKMQLAKIINYE